MLYGEVGIEMQRFRILSRIKKDNDNLRVLQLDNLNRLTRICAFP